MSKSGPKKKVVVSTASNAGLSPTVSKARKTTPTSPKSRQPEELIFGRTNYLWMLGGIALIGLGLVLMSGGGMDDPNVWDETKIYSTRRTVVGPFVIILGIVVEIVAIFRKHNDDKPVVPSNDL